MNEKFLPDMNPPSGGQERLRRRMKEQVDAQSGLFGLSRGPRSNGLGPRGTIGLVLVIAAAIALYIYVPGRSRMQEVMDASDDLVLYKYGLKKMPADNLLLTGKGDARLIKRRYGYELVR